MNKFTEHNHHYTEEWRAVEGFPHYQVSSFGRVKSLDRSIFYKKKARLFCGKILKPIFNKYRGYNKIGLHNNITNKQLSIHRLVALAFLPRIEGKCYVNHIDGNKINNHVSNLEWVDCKENTQHAVRLGLMSTSKSQLYAMNKKSVLKCSKPVILLDHNYKIKRITKSFSDMGKFLGIVGKKLYFKKGDPVRLNGSPFFLQRVSDYITS